ncbi:IucA/IucC family protein [Salinithrix halophila]|uniref:IucA/IucC family protein n=1 Tax=Salinithrix halophila TaxID=1485204 RepID=A0ABV8JA41_9BACL
MKMIEGDSRTDTESAVMERDLDALLQETVKSQEYVAVRRRIFRQLVESLLYEGVLGIRIEEKGGVNWFVMEGRTEAGEPVLYRAPGTRRFTFNRIRLTGPVERVEGGRSEEASSLALFLTETKETTGADPERLKGFIRELEETLFKDALCQTVRRKEGRRFAGRDGDALEAELMDGHPYHPSYKSRVGFDVAAHLAYGPEFRRPIHPVWVAARQEATRVDALDPGWETLVRRQLGDALCTRFARRIQEAGQDLASYVWLPLHPWQWRNVVAPRFQTEIQEGTLIWLGESEEAYHAQQSIRTLMNADAPDKEYLKLALSILNTSTGRVLAPHTVANAPRVSGWMKQILAADPFLQEEIGLVLLGETAGASFIPTVPEAVRDGVYGVMGSIWRESIHPFLEEGEAFVAFNGLTQRDTDGTPLIDAWVKEQGVEEWTQLLLQASVIPLIHLLYAHGIGVEAHAQNMVLIHEGGIPKRVALKDFHDGIRFSRQHLAAPIPCPELEATPEEHARVNRNSFIETEDPRQVSDFMHDAFFFINLGELAMFLHDAYDLSEERFWSMVQDIIHSYQARFPEQKLRYERFDLFSPTVEVEQLTKRRLFPETEIRVHPVDNSLSPLAGKEGRTCATK